MNAAFKFPVSIHPKTGSCPPHNGINHSFWFSAACWWNSCRLQSCRAAEYKRRRTLCSQTNWCMNDLMDVCVIGWRTESLTYCLLCCSPSLSLALHLSLSHPPARKPSVTFLPFPQNACPTKLSLPFSLRHPFSPSLYHSLSLPLSLPASSLLLRPQLAETRAERSRECRESAEKKGRMEMMKRVDKEESSPREEDPLWCRVVTSSNESRITVTRRIPSKDY